MNATPVAFDPATIARGLFGLKLTDGSPYGPEYAPVTVRAVKGRCVHLTLSGEPEWTDIAYWLLGDGRCDDFRLEGRDLFLRLKTPEQIEADSNAFDYDEKNGALCTQIDWLNIENIAAPPKKKAPRAPQQRTKKGRLELAITDYVEASEANTFSRRQLLTDVREQLDKDGEPVRPDNLAKALRTQIMGTLLEEVPDTEGEQLRRIE